jgi:RimJ/RimL family protein N-acetyltransferase
MVGPPCATVTPRPQVRLRPILHSDFLALYEQQKDPVAAQLAGFTPRDWPAFLEHQRKAVKDPQSTLRTIVVDDRVAGSVLAFPREGAVELGYWVARADWGRGVASAAVRQFLAQVSARPLMAYVAEHNLASRRVLEKCGFEVLRLQPGPPGPDGGPVNDFVLQLR